MRLPPPPLSDEFVARRVPKSRPFAVDSANNPSGPRSLLPMPRIFRKTRGFTMIELLVAIGIIALLAGILLYALKHITGQSKTQATKVALENLKSMLGEFETQTRLGRQPPFWTWQYGGPVIQSGGGLDFWLRPRSTAGGPDKKLDLDAPGDVREGSPPRDGSRGVLNTTLVMNLIASIGVNRSAIQNLRPDQMFLPEWTDKQYTGPSDNDHVLHLQGDQPESVVYVIGSRVRHQGKSYICIDNEPSGNPASNGSALEARSLAGPDVQGRLGQPDHLRPRQRAARAHPRGREQDS